MIIWLALIVPLVGTIITFICFRKKMTWWELLIPTTVCLLFIFVFKSMVEKSIVDDEEYIGALGIEAQYYERWETWVKRTCISCTGSGKTRSCHTYDCSYCDLNDERFYLLDELGRKFEISKSKYGELRSRWKATPQKVELNRKIVYKGSCGKDGNMFKIHWDKKELTTEGTTTTQLYENRIKAAHSVFKYGNVSQEERKIYGIHEYPQVKGYTQKSILGIDSLPQFTRREVLYMQKMVEYLNGYWGPRKHGRIWVLFYNGIPSVAGNYQEWAWEGGNDNEIVICIGLEKGTKKINWVKPFTWSPNRKIIPQMRDEINSIKVLNGFTLYKAINKHMEEYERKDFKEFDYLTLDPPTWAIVVTFIVSIFLTLFVCYWAVVNEESHHWW